MRIPLLTARRAARRARRDQETKQRLTDVVTELGDATNTEEVAAYLGALGIGGIPATGATCPVANYIRQRSGYPHVSVDGSTAAIFDKGFSRTIARVTLPSIVEDFTNDFDNHKFPWLEETL